MISSLGIGTGLDLESIVTQLVVAESGRLTSLQTRANVNTTKLTVVGAIKSKTDDVRSAILGLRNMDSLLQKTATSSDENKVTATSTGAASIGQNSLNVTQIAKNHQITSNSEFSVGADIGATGAMQISVGTSNFQIIVDSNNNTLSDIRAAINDASDNPGVTASIITVGTEGNERERLVLTANETGSSSAISVTDLSGTLAATTLGLTDGTRQEIVPAHDAIFTLNTFSVTRSSNTVTDAIEGVTLNIVDTGEANITITDNPAGTTSEIQKKISTFIAEFNGLVDLIDETEVTTFAGDTGFGLLKNNVINEVLKSTSTTGTYNTFAEIGVTLTKFARKLTADGQEYVSSGKLEIDSAELTKAIETDFDSVINIFDDVENGLANRLNDVVGAYLQGGGVFANREEAITAQNKRIDTNIGQEITRLDKIEARLRAQFSAMDQIVSSLQSTSNFLTQQLARLPSPNASSSG